MNCVIGKNEWRGYLYNINRKLNPQIDFEINYALRDAIVFEIEKNITTMAIRVFYRLEDKYDPNIYFID
jgi:hypothetical protein